MTRDEIKQIIDIENGKGFSRNINLNGYTFTKNNSFITFEIKIVEEVKICHIKYIHIENQKDFITIMVNVCNFLMGNKVQFIFYKEKERKNSKQRIDFLKNLNFRYELIEAPNWRYNFECLDCFDNNCICHAFNMFK